jgi:hypothetical protein
LATSLEPRQGVLDARQRQARHSAQLIPMRGDGEKEATIILKTYQGMKTDSSKAIYRINTKP